MNLLASFTTDQLEVGGLTPLTTIDYPDELAAVVFCQGCPWRCRYCHNEALVKRNMKTNYLWPDILEKLMQRIGLLDAVVFSGGEPTLQPALANAINDVKALNFKAGLHTAGCCPDRLKRILPLLDWIGLDIKALPEDYEQLTGVPQSGQKAWQSLKLLSEANIDHEVRITVHGNLLSPGKLQTLLQRLSTTGIKNIALQHCRTDNLIDPSLGANQINWENSPCINYAQNHFEKLVLRLPS